MKMVNILITGGAGFVGAHFIEHFLRKTDWNIKVLDSLSYASFGLDRLRDNQAFFSPRVCCLTWDLTVPLSVGMKRELGDINYIFHLASSTHVDNSIKNPVDTVYNNIMMTVQLLEYAKSLKNLVLFHYMGTDESFGSADEGMYYKEDDKHTPTNPYSASKSGAEKIVMAYGNTFNIPWLITNAMNIYGERQHVEKFIPKVIKKILQDELVHIHSYPDRKKAGSRSYIHARNVADAILFLVQNNRVNECFNIPGQKELDNLELALYIAKVMKRELKYEMVDFHVDRPGHDLRYMLDGTKLFSLGWEPPIDFEQSIRHTIEWTVEHQMWLEEE